MELVIVETTLALEKREEVAFVKNIKRWNLRQVDYHWWKAGRSIFITSGSYDNIGRS